MTVSPMVSWLISLSPRLSSSCTILETVCSMRSGSTLRLRNAISNERASLSRSNGTRRPLRLMTVSSRSCTRSNVVKRNWHERHTRRRRIAAESSVGRESFTCVSRLPHFGQRMAYFPLPARFARRLRPCILLINREARDQRLHLLANGRLDHRILIAALLRQYVEHLDDHVANLAEFREAEAPRRAGRRAEPHAGSDHRLRGIERNAVLVAGGVRAAQRDLGDLAGQALRTQVDQHEMIVGATRDDIEPFGLEPFGERLGVCHNVPRVNLEFGPQGLAECDRLGGNHVH